MAANDLQATSIRPAGYAALVKQLGITVMPNWHESMVAFSDVHRLDATGGVVREMYTARYWPGAESDR